MVLSRAIERCRSAMQVVWASLLLSEETIMGFSFRLSSRVVLPHVAKLNAGNSSSLSGFCSSIRLRECQTSHNRISCLDSFLLHCRYLSALSSRARSFGGSSRRRTVASSLKGKQDGERGSVGALDEEGGEDGSIGRPQDGRVVPVEMHKELVESYQCYAMSVLVGRALPDARDGLKPVHRRLLYAMYELGLSSRKPFKKCARVVGEVLGKFHPHGDSAVYEALVRMAQDFSLRSPLINGHGNFGSLDADPPAAMRYTECRLEALSESMLLEDLKSDTVDFIPNFDGSQLEPSVLPARVPNLLLNGASGIAVGMATHIPPHNLGELVDALCALIHNPNATVQELMEHLPGPDFPTGGHICGSVKILEAYRTGKGKLRVRGTTLIEQLDASDRHAIIIKEIPYQTNKAALVEKIAELVNNKILVGISDVRDESDRTGMRVLIEMKRGSNPLVILNNLYKHTSLECSFCCNMVGIIKGRPVLMGLKDVLQEFLDFRCSVIERRARFELNRAEERDHLVQGILIGLENLDEVVNIVRSADATSSASETLQRTFKLSEDQAEALLAMTLRRLTSLERKNFAEEHNVLTLQILELKQLLGSKQRILQVVEREAVMIKKEFGTPRRTLLLDQDPGELSDIDVVTNEEVLVTLSEKGYVKRMKPDTFTAQNRGTIGKSLGKLKGDDALSDFLFCWTHDYLLFFSDKGTVFSARALHVPEYSRTATGSPIVQILPIPLGERITSVKSVRTFAEDQFLVMLTSGGYIKRTPLSLFSGIRSHGIAAIQLEPGDELKWVRLAAENDTVVVCSQGGFVVRTICDNDRFRAIGRRTRGVKSMRLKDGDRVAAMDIVPAEVLQRIEEKKSTGPWLLFVTENGFGKRTQLALFTPYRLNRRGAVGFKFQDSNDRLTSIFVVGSTIADDGETDEEVVLGSHAGILNRLKVRDIAVRKRARSGVILMRLEEGDKVNSVSLVTPAQMEDNSSTGHELQAMHV
eukprot:c25978_g1_i1 orf=224-3175(+)